MDDDDDTSQRDEIEVLTSIYDEALVLLPSSSGKSFEIRINEATLRLNFPSDYPSRSAPSYELSAPFLSREEKEEISCQMKDVLASLDGMPVVYSLADCVREFLESHCQNGNGTNLQKTELNERVQEVNEADIKLSSVECPEITTGDCIEDRKSVFQGHFAHVTSMDEVKAVISRLYENRKIANATHNMYAYRIRQQKGNYFFAGLPRFLRAFWILFWQA